MMFPMESTRFTSAVSADVNVRAYVARVFMWMSAGLAVTAILAWPLGHSPHVVARLNSSPWLTIGLVVAIFAMLFAILTVARRSESATLAGSLFLVFCGLQGVFLAPVVAYYSDASLVACFATASGMFGAVGAFGYVTQRDLSRLGSILLMALWGLILAMVINLFIASSTASLAISVIGVFLFCGLTAYDMQNIRRMAETQDARSSSAVLGALNLYLDLLNLMLFLLRIFGNSR